MQLVFDLFSSEGINEPSLCSPASMALKAIATECIFELAPYAETILTSCQQALAANNLKVSCLFLWSRLYMLLTGICIFDHFAKMKKKDVTNFPEP